MNKLTKKDIILLIASIIFLISTVISFTVVLLNSDLFKNDEVDAVADAQPHVTPPEEVSSDLTINIDGVKFDYILFEEINEIKDNQFIIVITKEDCPSCQRFMNNLAIFKSTYTSIPVYLINFDTLSEEKKKEYALIPGYLFYNEGECFYTGRGNVEAEKLYEKFITNLKED